MLITGSDTQFPGGSCVYFQVNRNHTLSLVAVMEDEIGDYDDIDGEFDIDDLSNPGSILTFKVDEEGNLKLRGIVMGML